ncbi:MAG TPA: AAA family ATPase [Desulfuromonadales bacterium]|nr:AAA family ATPase [Desulfuromonadales bacterium]
MKKPHVIVIAGSHGAGKTTIAPALLKDALGISEFVNADLIAAGLSAFHPDKAAWHAGHEMLRRLHQLAEKRENFAFESTLAGKALPHWIKMLKEQGYLFTLFFLWIASPELAMARVSTRMTTGGLSVPTRTVKRRYLAGIDNFFEIYLPLADSWFFYDNSENSGPQLMASGFKYDGRDVDYTKALRNHMGNKYRL